jgi:hypothetical protein
MSQGRFVVDESEMPEFALELIKSAKKRILATSYVQVTKWWETPWGKQYEDLNEKKAKGGVTITRIFIFSTKDEMGKIEDLMRADKNAGIEIKYAYANDLNYRITSDMIVIDDNLSGELRLTPDKGMTVAEFMTKPGDISETERRINSVDVQSASYGNAESPATKK